MPYRVHIRPAVAKKIAGWALSDYVLVDVYLFLNEVLASDPMRFLRRVPRPFDGMVYEFSLIDPENRLRQHFFVFQVVYAQDEQSLIIANGAYLRSDGM
jgi:hypothetical protein